MLLSDAIRLGAMLHPQAFKMGVRVDDHGEVIATCAVHAAFLAGYHWDITRWPLQQAERQLLRCPLCGKAPLSLSLPSQVAHLNDKHRLTREQIADWVQSLELAGYCTDDTPVAVSEPVPVLLDK